MLISEALEGKYYRSRSYARKGLDGIIQFAEPKFIHGLGENEFSYVVKVRPQFVLGQIVKDDFYATLIVKGETE
jgi:hypothetical protein